MAGEAPFPVSDHCDGTLFFNPGYAGKPRFGLERTVAILHYDQKGIRTEYLPL